MGLLHHRDLADSLGHVVGSTSLQVIATCLVMYLARLIHRHSRDSLAGVV